MIVKKVFFIMIFFYIFQYDRERNLNQSRVPGCVLGYCVTSLGLNNGAKLCTYFLQTFFLDKFSCKLKLSINECGVKFFKYGKQLHFAPSFNVGSQVPINAIFILHSENFPNHTLDNINGTYVNGHPTVPPLSSSLSLGTQISQQFDELVAKQNSNSSSLSRSHSRSTNNISRMSNYQPYSFNGKYY